MRVSARWHAAVLNVDIVEGRIIGAAKDKTFAPAQKNLCQSQWQLALAAEASAGRGTSVPWRKPSDGRESVLSTLPSGSSFFALVEAQAVERGNAQRRGEVAVAAAGQRHVVQLLADLPIERLRLQFTGSIYSRPVLGGLHHPYVRD
jgi:hypothetical protein